MTPNESNILHCPSCGAALQDVGNQPQVECPYCGNTIVNSAAAAAVAAEQSAKTERGLVKSILAVVFGGTVLLPILIGVLTLCIMACVFGMVWFSLSPILGIFRALPTEVR